METDIAWGHVWVWDFKKCMPILCPSHCVYFKKEWVSGLMIPVNVCILTREENHSLLPIFLHA